MLERYIEQELDVVEQHERRDPDHHVVEQLGQPERPLALGEVGIRRDSPRLTLTSGAPVLFTTRRNASVSPAPLGHENQPVVQRLGAVDAGQHPLGRASGIAARMQ